MAFHTHQIFDFGMAVVGVCSVLHTFLPPWEAFNDYPRIQKAYKLFVYLVGWFGVNMRSTIYPQISTQEGAQASKAASDPASPSNPINKETK